MEDGGIIMGKVISQGSSAENEQDRDSDTKDV